MILRTFSIRPHAWSRSRACGSHPLHRMHDPGQVAEPDEVAEHRPSREHRRGAEPGDLLDVPGGEVDSADQPRMARRVHDAVDERSEEHTSELQSRGHIVCRLLLEKKK